MSYNKNTEKKVHVDSVFDVKGELVFWVRKRSNGKLFASTGVKDVDGTRMFYTVNFRKEIDLTDFDEGMNKINVKSGFISCYKHGDSVGARIMVVDFE